MYFEFIITSLAVIVNQPKVSFIFEFKLLVKYRHNFFPELAQVVIDR